MPLASVNLEDFDPAIGDRELQGFRLRFNRNSIIVRPDHNRVPTELWLESDCPSTMLQGAQSWAVSCMGAHFTSPNVIILYILILSSDTQKLQKFLLKYQNQFRIDYFRKKRIIMRFDSFIYKLILISSG